MFILDTMNGLDISEIRRKYEEYNWYLENIKDHLPSGIREYALAPWHYQVGLHDARCPHDAWVESLEISEVAAQESVRTRHVQITLQLLNAFHTAHLKFFYTGVSNYTVSMADVTNSSIYVGVNREHNDWLIDEIRLAFERRIVHEIVFALGSHWTIESEGLSFEFIPKEVIPRNSASNS